MTPATHMRGEATVSFFSAALVVAAFAATAHAQEPVLELHMRPRIDLEVVHRGTYVVESKDSVNEGHWLARAVLHYRPGPLATKLSWIDPVEERSKLRVYRAVEIETSGGVPIENMVWIPAGTFAMGSPAGEEGHFHDEGPQTVVTISRGFWMGKHEVTQKDYVEMMGDNPSMWQWGDDYPVEQVNWFDAVAFCEKLTDRERALDHLRDGYVYRLPTEAEWEYACRAGTTTRYSFGDDFAFSSQYGIPNENPYSVGQLRPNTFGLYDMHGDVSEWVLDCYTPYPGGSVTDPVQRGSGIATARGGSWAFYTSATSRSANRLVAGWQVASDEVGFRIVLAPAVEFDPNL